MSVMTTRTLDRSESLDSCSSANTSISSDSEHTLSAYGDISHSEINFVPTGDDAPALTSFPNPNRRDPSYRRNAKRPQPPTNSRRGTMMRNLPADTDLNDFTALLDSLRASRDRAEASHRPVPSIRAELIKKLGLGVPPIGTENQRPISADTCTPEQPQAKQVDQSSKPRTMRKVPAPLQLKNSTYQVQPASPSPIKTQAPPNTPASPISPNAKRPWRGNGPLPQRLPLPRWELLDPDVSREGMKYKVKVK